MSMTDLDEIVRRMLRLNTHSDSRSRWSVVHISAIKTWICEEGHNIWTYRRLRWSSAVKEVIGAFAGDLQIDISERNEEEIGNVDEGKLKHSKGISKELREACTDKPFFLCTALCYTLLAFWTFGLTLPFKISKLSGFLSVFIVTVQEFVWIVIQADRMGS